MTKTRRKKKQKAKPTTEGSLSAKSRLLFYEVSDGGQARTGTVESLIEEGADPNILNKEGLSPLALAAINDHLDCMQVLVNKGANVNLKMRKGNTALHEAVLAGPRHIDSIEVLLGCHADPDVTNAAGDKPYDIAVKKGYEEIVKCFATNVGVSLLGKMTKPTSFTL
jgi:ankyrin repeat protein